MVFFAKKNYCTLLFSSFALTAAFAQTPDTAAVRGIVNGPDGHPLVGAHLQITGTAFGFERTATTGEHGDFTLSGLPVGLNLTLHATESGFAPAILRQLVLEAGATATLHIALQVNGGGNTHRSNRSRR